MKEITSDNILKGILNNDSSVIQYIYDKYYRAIKSFVTKHGGSKDDAWDIFQDGIVIVYEQVKNRKLKLENTFMTYFFSICKYQWLKTLRDRNRKYYESIEGNREAEHLLVNEDAAKLDETIEKEKRIRLYNENYQKLSESCQKVLKLVSRDYSIKEIAKLLGYKSEGFAYKKRRECKERLIQLINENINKQQL